MLYCLHLQHHKVLDLTEPFAVAHPYERVCTLRGMRSGKRRRSKRIILVPPDAPITRLLEVHPWACAMEDAPMEDAPCAPPACINNGLVELERRSYLQRCPQVVSCYICLLISYTDHQPAAKPMDTDRYMRDRDGSRIVTGISIIGIPTFLPKYNRQNEQLVHWRVHIRWRRPDGRVAEGSVVCQSVN